MIDFKLVRNEEEGYFDIVLNENGDFDTVESFDTSLIVSLFTDSRAAPSEVSLPQYRRGWWGDTVSDDTTLKIGSKLWLLGQSRILQNTLNNAINYCQLALNWLITYKYSLKVDVNAIFIDNNGISISIKIRNKNGQTLNKAYKLWVNSGHING